VVVLPRLVVVRTVVGWLLLQFFQLIRFVLLVGSFMLLCNFLRLGLNKLSIFVDSKLLPQILNLVFILKAQVVFVLGFSFPLRHKPLELLLKLASLLL